MQLVAMGDSAVLIRLGDRIDLPTHRRIMALCTRLAARPPAGMIEYVPAFSSVAVIYDPARVATIAGGATVASPYERMCLLLEPMLADLENQPLAQPRLVEVPVCYGGEFGPDLEFVAARNHLTTSDVIDIHAGGEYLTYMVGFAPGFAYLGGMSTQIASPRRDVPRLAVAAGSVGIAGGQTGIYSIKTPGGWQIIGRTPLRLFRPEGETPTLLSMGDKVRFRPITEGEFRDWKGGGQ